MNWEAIIINYPYLVAVVVFGIGTVTVSYTHLDVYKRQVYTYLIFIKSGALIVP